MTARLDVLAEGYADDRVASTVVLVRDGDAIIVVDPGMVASRSLILDPLSADQELLEASRAELLALRPALVVPGHGSPFTPA